MNRLSHIAAWIFGLAMTGLSFFVTADVISRKVLGISFEGADELGGYTLAVGAALTFIVALSARAHMRIDVLYGRLSSTPRAVLDWLALVSLAAMAGLLVFLGQQMLGDSLSYGSTAPTPWATPLVWPQSIWLLALVLFLAICLLALVQATRLLLTGRTGELTARFGTSGESDELKAELADLERRR